MSSDRPELPGLVVLERLHRGYHVDVYDVWSQARGCRCVAKALRPDKPPDERSVTALLAEGRLLRRLTHPHIVRGYDVTAEPPLVLLETLSGHTLSALLDDRGRLPVRDVAHLGLHLCSAVGYLHRHRRLHLDLKPSNVIAEAGRAKLIDLSLARRPGRYRVGLGTPGYLSPEQALGQRLGPPADVWGIAGLLFEMLTGEPAGPDPSRGSQTHSSAPSSTSSSRDESGPVVVLAPPPLRRHRRVPADLARVVDAGLALDPGSRPTIPELAAALGAVVAAPWIPHAT